MDPMEQALMAQQIGPGYSRIASQGHPSIDASAWAPVLAALGLLSDREQDTMPNIDIKHEARQPAFAAQKNAFVDPANPSNINVVDSSDLYHNATKGKMGALQQLAAVLMHERHHVEHGADEGSAYDAQIEALKRLGAPSRQIEEAEQAKSYVTNNR